MKTTLVFLTHALYWVSAFLFYIMPLWIVVSSFFTFMAFLFLVPLYMPIWLVLRWISRKLKTSPLLDEQHQQKLNRAIVFNTRALKYNFYLSIPIVILFLGYLSKMAKN